MSALPASGKAGNSVVLVLGLSNTVVYSLQTIRLNLLKLKLLDKSLIASFSQGNRSSSN